MPQPLCALELTEPSSRTLGYSDALARKDHEAGAESSVYPDSIALTHILV
jgi:hypothetical protein